jgi:citrate synthase
MPSRPNLIRRIRAKACLASSRSRRWSSASDPEPVTAARLQRGDPITAFGHPLYPEGDPRGRALHPGLIRPRARYVGPVPQEGDNG